MFTEGRLIFSILFLIIFIFAIIYSYKKDKKVHFKNYKNTFWVLIGSIMFVIILTLLKYLINK
jgi:formate hydrogenlyase subunit 3/multisubunit Na+/H+ antiporter MnhD subunit